eukprot:gene689-8941_t
MNSEDKENKNVVTTPRKKMTKKRNIRKALSPKSPNQKKQRRVSFASMKVVYDENPEKKQQAPRRTSIANFSSFNQKNKRKSVAKGLQPKTNIITTNEKPVDQPTKVEEENLETFKQELDGLSSCSSSDNEDENSLNFSIDDTLLSGEKEQPKEITKKEMSNSDYGKIIAEARELLKDHKETEKKVNMTTGTIFTSKGSNDTNYTNLSIPSQITKTDVIDKTMDGGRMSLTRNDYGKVVENDVGNQTMMNESRMSLTNHDFGKIEGNMDESRMSIAASDYGGIELNKSTRKSLTNFNQSRMSLTQGDFGNIEKVDSVDLNDDDFDGLDESRMSIAASDYGEIEMNKSRKSLTNYNQSRMSLTQNDFGTIESLDFDSSGGIDESRMSLAVSDYGDIELNKSTRKSLTNKFNESRMSLTNTDLGKIIQEEEEKESTIEENKPTKEDMKDLEDMESSDESIDFDTRMSLTKNNYGSISAFANEKTKLFGSDDSSDDENREEENFDTVDDLLENLKDDSLNLSIALTGRQSILEEIPEDVADLLDQSNSKELEEKQQEKENQMQIEQKTDDDSIDLGNKTNISSRTQNNTIQFSSPTTENLKKKLKAIRNNTTPNESIDLAMLNRTNTMNLSNVTMTTPSQKLIKSVKQLSSSKSAKRNLLENIESAAVQSRNSTRDLSTELTSSLRMTPQKRINEIKKNYANEKQESMKDELIKFNPINVSDFLLRSDIRFLDDLSNQRRPTSSIGLKKSEFNKMNNVGKIQIATFIGAEVEVYESSCSKIYEISENLKKEILDIEESYNLKNPLIFQHIQRIKGDELSDFCKNLKQLKQICKLKSEIFFYEMKENLEDNLLNLVSNDLNNFSKDLNSSMEHVKHLDSLINEIELEIQKIESIINDNKNKEKREEIKSILSKNDNEIKFLKENLMKENQKLKETVGHVAVENFKEINQMSKELNSSFKFEIQDNRYLTVYSDDFNIQIEFEGQKVLTCTYELAKCSDRGEVNLIENYLKKQIPMKNLLSSINVLDDIPSILQLISFKFSRIHQLKQQLEQLTLKKIYFKMLLQNHEMSVLFSITDFKTKRFTFTLPLTLNWPFENYQNTFQFSKGNTTLTQEAVAGVIDNVDCSFERLLNICENLKKLI